MPFVSLSSFIQIDGERASSARLSYDAALVVFTAINATNYAARFVSQIHFLYEP